MSLFNNRLTVFALLGGLVLLFPADGLRALGLGEARVDSYLGQPLDVTIRLLEAESDAVDAMTVTPASPADHERLGLPSESLGLGLDVSIDRASQPPTIRLRSQRPANDPVVQVLLDARFASGRVLREYTLFLDPPTIDSPPPVRRAPEEVAEVEADVAPAPREERPVSRQPAPAPAPADPEPATERPRITDDAVTVARGDTLWGIGYNWRPDSGMSMDQVMLAIFERNRHAFMDENINRLRSGAELDMPSADEVRGVSRGEAEQRIREHMQAWQQADPARDVPVVADAGVPEADPVEPAPATTEEPEDVVHRLDVVPPEDDEFGDGPAVSDGEVRRVRGALADIEEDIVSERLDGEEFDEHVAEIREALDSREMAGLAFAEESLAELEARLREARRERAEAEQLAAVEEDDVDVYFSDLERELVGDPDEATPVPDDEPAVAAVDDVRDPDGELAPADPVTDPMDEAAPAEGDQRVAAASELETQTGLALWQWLAMAIAVIVVVLIAVGAFLFLKQRRNADGEASGHVAVADGETDARKAVVRNPSNLAAHLALLKVLADRDENERFADALDQMYQHVDDEADAYWQEALGLALVHAPDHPMLTPPETTPGEVGDEELDRRTDEMLSMFDVDDETEERPTEDDSELDTLEPDDERSTESDPAFTELDMEPDDERVDAVTEDAVPGNDEEFGEDLDLGELSNRLDKPEAASGSGDESADDDDDFEIGGFADDEPESDDQPSEVEQTRSEDRGYSLDLDFEPGSQADEQKVSTGEPSATDADAPESGSDLEYAGLDWDMDSEPDLKAPAEPEAGSGIDERDRDSDYLDSDDDGLTLDFEDGSSIDDDSARDMPATDESDVGSAEDAEALDEPGVFELDDEASSVGVPLDETGEEALEQAESQGDAELSDEDADVKLDLARAYMSVDLADSARTILEEVVAGGNPDKQDEAQKLLEDL